MTISISARYLQLLNAARGKNDPRYYINGICVEPNPAGGAFLVATNGHVMVVVCDEHAHVDKTTILPVPSLIVSHAKKADRAVHREDEWRLVDADGKLVAGAHGAVIQGQYPNWRAVVPKGEPNGIAAFQPQYLCLLSHVPATEGKRPNAAIVYAHGDQSPMTVRFHGSPEILIVVMPMRTTNLPPAMPHWLNLPADVKAA